jgi:hypothetical protein
LLKPLLFAVSKVVKEERAKKEREAVDIPAVTPADGNRLRDTPASLSRLRDTPASLSVHRTRRQSQMCTRQVTPPKVTTTTREVKRERWSQRREMKQRLEEAK